MIERRCGTRGVWLRPKNMTSRRPIEVCITIDTEFSIAGNFADPELLPVAEPIVLGEIDGKEHGLGFLLNTFAEFGVRATFFVEALQTAYFGDEPMGAIARRIAEAGQDVQLHLHPCWLYYEATSGQEQKATLDDSCAHRSDAELDHFFEVGISAFSRWGLTRPVAVRSGNFEVDANFYRAAARSGINSSSSIALAVRRPSDETLVPAGNSCTIEQVLEFPVFSYSHPFGLYKRLRPLAITACSSTEILSALWQAHEYGISPVVILTHPQEYIKHKGSRYTTLRPNRVNQTRLKTLLRFLRQHDDEFVAVPLYAIEQSRLPAVSSHYSEISVSARHAIGRMAENAINDLVWWY